MGSPTTNNEIYSADYGHILTPYLRKSCPNPHPQTLLKPFAIARLTGLNKANLIDTLNRKVCLKPDALLGELKRDELKIARSRSVSPVTLGHAKKGQTAASITTLLSRVTSASTSLVRALHFCQEDLRRETNPERFTKRKFAPNMKRPNSFVTSVMDKPTLMTLRTESDARESAQYGSAYTARKRP